MMKSKPLSTIALLLACTGCVTQKPVALSQTGGVSEYRLVGGSELPPPSPNVAAGSERPYRIGPFDKLRIDVYGVEDLSKQEVQADASGRISFPLIGVVDAGGKTPGDLATLMERQLTRYIRQPEVTVNLLETVSQVVTVDGAVIEPGLYPVIGRMTLMRAIARAKGLSEFAKTSQIAIFRDVDGRQMAAIYNLKAIREGRLADPEVFANDVVVVGDSQTRRIFKDVLTAAPLITTPLLLLFQRR